MSDKTVSIVANIVISVLTFWLYTYVGPAVAISFIALLILNNIDRVLWKMEAKK
jgi:hypothetical protein